MVNSLAHLQGIMVVVFIITDIQFKMIDTTTMIPSKHVRKG